MLSRFNKVVLSFLAMNTPGFAFDTVLMDDQSSLFSALDKTVPIISSSYIGWNSGWKWAVPNVKSTHSRQLPYEGSTFSGQSSGLRIDFTGEAKQSSNKEINWTYQWDRQKDMPNAIGLGIQFDFKLNSPSFSDKANDPVLLPNHTGWKWTTPNGQTVEVTFSPAIAKVYFDQGNTSKIRALFFEDISKGKSQTTMSVKVSQPISLNRPSALNYDSSDESLWHKDILPVDTSPIDLSFLNKDHIPAGKHGFVIADKDKLFFEDNTPAKFWGTNVQAYALFLSSDTEVKRHAKRIAKLGFNLVRIHHHDSSWVLPNVFKNPDSNTYELSEEALKKIDWWVKCLRDEGIYLWIDLHVGRRFTKDDGIDGFSDFSYGKDHAEARGFNYYNDDVKNLMKAFNHAYLTRVNSFTNLAFKDDPSVMAYLITNENDLTHHFGNALLEDKGVPVHNALFEKDVKAFSKAHKLAEYKVKQTWKMGESKIYLNDVEHRFNQEMIDQLDGLGIKSLISTTNSWGQMGIFGLPSLTDGSIIDTHSYGRADEFKYNPRYTPGFLTWVGAAQVSAKPLSITEWNIEPFPAEDRFTAPIYMASIANLQGWDAIMHYGYSQSSKWDTVGGSNYSTFNDPAMTGLMPAAALLYRQNHVEQANTTYELKLDRNDFFFTHQDPKSSKAVRTLLETSRFTIGIPETPELPWMNDNLAKEDGAIIVRDANEDFIPQGQSFVESDTGELKRDWSKGIHTINTQKSQVVSGWAGGESIELDDVKFDIKTKNVVFAVQSLENRPISQSNKIFITAMARSKPEKGNALPFISEPVVGQIEIKAIAGLRLYPINNKGIFDQKIAIKLNQKGNYVINLTSDMKYHWFVLQDTVPAFNITFPADSAEYSEGGYIQLKTNVNELEKEISKVEYFYGDWSLISTIEQKPYEFGLIIPQKGSYTIRSRVTFKDGSKASSKIALSIKEAPFQVVSPYQGEEIAAGTPVTIKTNVLKWKDKVKSVAYWKDNWSFIDTSTTAPYEYTVSDFSAGEHFIRTRVTFLDGTSLNSKVISFNVSGTAGKKPQTLEELTALTNKANNTNQKDASDNKAKMLGDDFRLSTPIDGTTYQQGETITFRTNASNWDGSVRLVQYWVDNWTYLQGSNTSPYEFSTNRLSVGEHFIRSRLTFNDGTERDTSSTIHITKSGADFNAPIENKSAFDLEKGPAFKFSTPEDGATIPFGQPIVFKIRSKETSANIDSVYYWYDNWKWIGRTITEPYEKAVSHLSSGEHAIHSRIIYRNGTTDLTNIKINVARPNFKITSPAINAVLGSGSTITLQTNAESLDGNIMSIHFWKDNWKHIDGVYSEPYQLVIDGLSVGEHLLRARVIFDDATTLDTNVTVIVQ